jgi:chromosome segregation ATPase
MLETSTITNILIAVVAITTATIALVQSLYRRRGSQAKQAEAEHQKIITLEGNVAALRGEVTSLKAKASSLEGEVSSLQAEASSLQGEVSALQAEVLALGESAKSLGAEVRRLKSQLHTLISTVKDRAEPRASAGSDGSQDHRRTRRRPQR